MRGRRHSGALLTAVVAVGTMAVPAFTDDTGLGSTSAGDGAGDVSGFTVSSIHYEPSADPGLLDHVTFRLDPAPGPDASVLVVLAEQEYPCVTGGSSATCDTSSPSVAIADVTQFRVVAAD